MKGWLSIAAVVVAYDGWALATDRPTLSGQFKAASRSQPRLTAAGTVYLIAHLYGVWPAKADPFNLFAVPLRSQRARLASWPRALGSRPAIPAMTHPSA